MTKLNPLLTAASLALVLAGCSSFGGPSSPGALSAGLSARMDQPNATLDSQQAIDLINAYRATRNMPPLMGGEDFSYMLEARPGAFIFIGNGDSAGLHHPAYDFNDEVIAHGISYWAKLAETALAA